MSRWIRRLLVLAGVGVVVWAVLRRLDGDEPAPGTGPAAWPPLRMAETAASAASAAPSDPTDPVDQADQAPWVESRDGSCSGSHPVKGNVSSGIYHLPGGRFYDRTNADRCYVDAAAAEADGLRASKA